MCINLQTEILQACIISKQNHEYFSPTSGKPFMPKFKLQHEVDFRFQKNICNFRLILGLGHYLSPWSTMMEGNGYYLPPWSDHSGKVMDITFHHAI